MIEPPTASDVPDKCVGAPPLPHLTGEKQNVLVTEKRNLWRIFYVCVGFMVACAIVYSMSTVLTGVLLSTRVAGLFRDISAQVFCLALITLIYPLNCMQAINSILKRRKENAG